MHIWYIHPYAGGPGLGTHYRPYHLARAWKRQGHQATIFVAEFHHLLEAQSVPVPGCEIDGVRYVTISARPYAGNGTTRLLNMMDFCFGLRSAGRNYGTKEQKPDAVIVSSPHPFSIFAGHALARRYRAKLVFEIRDIWPLSLTAILGVSALHPFVQLCANAERFALVRANLIASVLPRADRYLAARGYGHRPFVWVPNGIDLGKVEPPALTSEAGRLACAKLEEWKVQGKTTIIYTGSIGAPNGIDLLLKALHHANSAGESNRCATLVVGRGEMLSELQGYAAENHLPDVHFSGWVPKNDAVALLKKADIGYAGLRDFESLFYYGISPNKIADYFNASLPVVLPVAPCGDPVSESGGGIARRATTPEAVWGALRELAILPPQERRALGARGKAYMAQEYDYDVIARRYAEAISGLRTTQ